MGGRLINVVLENRPILCEEYKGKFKGHEIGSGQGKVLGSMIPYILNAPPIVRPISMAIGHKYYKDKTKDIEYDNTDKNHRVSVNVARRLSAPNVGLTFVGSSIGKYGGKSLDDDLPNLKALSGVIGALPGITRMGYKGYQTAKQQGYGKVGRTFSTLTPATSLFTPKDVGYYDRTYRKEKKG